MDIFKREIQDFRTEKEQVVDRFTVSYTDTGSTSDLPVVLVIHALTGNSMVTGPNGWWRNLVGPGKSIDTRSFRVIGLDIPGNGHLGKESLLQDPKILSPGDVARIFVDLIDLLGIQEIYAGIGGSLGGGILWEMAPLLGERMRHLIPIACDWQSSDWLIGMTHVQDKILGLSASAMDTARQMAMLFYRSPESLSTKFSRSLTDDFSQFNVASWLDHHGQKLEQRFIPKAYTSMNHLLGSIDFSRSYKDKAEAIMAVKAEIWNLGISSDLLFPAYQVQNIHHELLSHGKVSHYKEVTSSHGHDAFLIEYKQLDFLLSPIFQAKRSEIKVQV